MINTKKPFVIIFTVVSLGLYGQSYVFFAPKGIDAALKAKLFYKNEVVLHVEKSEFKNGFNYITFYLINGSEKPLGIMAAFGEKAKNVVSGLLLYHTKKEAPYDLIYDLGTISEKKTEIDPVSSLVSVGAFCWEEALYPGQYIKQTLKIPCSGCTKANKITARITFEEYSGNLCNNYFSNGFEMYHNGESLPAKEVQNIEPMHMVNLMVGGGKDDNFINTNDLPYLDGQILTDITSPKLKGIGLDSGVVLKGFTITLFDALADSRFSEYKIEGDKLSAEIVNEIKVLLPASTIIISDVKVLNEKTGEEKTLTTTVYTIVE